MDVKKRTPNRKPLSDCTNSITTATTTTTPLYSSTVSPKSTPFSRTSKKQHKRTKSPHRYFAKFDTSIGSNNAEYPPLPSTPHQSATTSSSNSGGGDCEKSGSLIIYSRRQAGPLDRRNKNKRKKIATPLSCPQAITYKDLSGKLNQDGAGDVSTSHKDLSPKYKKRRYSLPGENLCTHTLPRDFIEQQRAYFAEIDAFELPEEVVSDSEVE